MATVYIIYSTSIDKFYIGSCKDFSSRLLEHNSGIYKNAFTRKAQDWQVYFKLDNLDKELARKIEYHIKAMKSRDYIKNLSSYPDIATQLIQKYSAGSSR